MNNNISRLALLTLLYISYSYPSALARAVSVRRLLHPRYPMVMLTPRTFSYKWILHRYSHIKTPYCRESIKSSIAHAEQQAHNALSRSKMYSALAAFDTPGEVNWNINLSLAAIASSEYRHWLDKAISLKRDLEKTKD